MCSYEKAGQPRYQYLGFSNRNYGNRKENFPYEQSRLVTEMQLFLEKAFLS